MHVFPISRWISYLILFPLSLAAFALTAFFFSAFLALFLIAGSVFGLWIWWLRRKLKKAAQANCLNAEYVVIEESHNLGLKAEKTGNP